MELPNLGGLRINEGRNGAVDAPPVETSGNAKQFIEKNLVNTFNRNPAGGWVQTLNNLHEQPLLRPTQMVQTLLGVLVEDMRPDAFIAALCTASVECWRYVSRLRPVKIGGVRREVNMAQLEAHMDLSVVEALRRCAEPSGTDAGDRAAYLALYRMFGTKVLPGTQPSGATAFEAIAHVFAGVSTKANVAFAFLVHEFFVEHLFRTRYSLPVPIPEAPGAPPVWTLQIPREEFYRLFQDAPNPEDTGFGTRGWKKGRTYQNADALISFLTGGYTEGTKRRVLGFKVNTVEQNSYPFDPTKIFPRPFFEYDNASGILHSKDGVDPEAFDAASSVHALFMAVSQYEQALNAPLAPAVRKSLATKRPRQDELRDVFKASQGITGWINKRGRHGDNVEVERREARNAEDAVRRFDLFKPGATQPMLGPTRGGAAGPSQAGPSRADSWGLGPLQGGW